MSMRQAGDAVAADLAVDISGLHKWYGEFHVLAEINLKVARGERIVICGPSGSGKSTLLRCINRLEEFQRGEIIVDGMVLMVGGDLLLHVRAVHLEDNEILHEVEQAVGSEHPSHQHF